MPESGMGVRPRNRDPEGVDHALSVVRLHELDGVQIEGLADVLIDCVEGGASVGFMHPISREKALEFWRKISEQVGAGKRILLVAYDEVGICGTVQLILAQPDNQSHRADLAKMLVHRRARRNGVGAALLESAEAAAKECGKTLLVLDAVTRGDAARLYERHGWMKVGDIPRYALMPDGEPCSTTYYFKELDRESLL